MAFVDVFQASVPEENVATLLGIRADAIAEAQRLCPQLLSAELVRLDDGQWLDILTWSVPDGAERLMESGAEMKLVAEMHSLFEVAGLPLHGEITHSSRT